MRKEIKQILKDIYSIDKSLQKQEEYLIKVIQDLLQYKPNTQIDESFVKELRVKVVERAELLTGKKQTKNMFNISFSKFSYAFAGAAVILLAVIAFINLPEKEIQGITITKTGDNAFGEITFSQDSSEQVAAEGEDRITSDNLKSEAIGMGGGGNSVASESLIVPAPDMVNYNYTYVGDDFEVQDGKVVVYKKVQGSLSNNSLNSLLGGIKLDDVDVKKFTNLKVDSIQISEDKSYGYTLYVYPKENTIYISQNWDKWPQQDWDKQPQKLSSQEVLSISDKFLKDYNINISAYGDGEVMESGRDDVFMESTTVIYPLIIEGQEVYNQSGNKYGLDVIVDFRTKRVSNVSNINVSNFQSSEYESDLTKDQIISFAEEGGLQRNYKYEDVSKTVDIKLGTPKYALVQTWNQASDSQFSELLVPSLIFPIENTEDYQYYYSKSIIVPLLGDMMNYQGGGPIRIMDAQAESM